MKTTIRCALAAVALLAAGTARAQFDTGDFKPKQTLWALSYDLAVPVGGMRDYVTDVGWAGLQVEGRFKLNQKFSAGLAFGWNRWTQTYSNYEVGTPYGGAVSGPLYRYVNFFNVRAGADYYVLDGPVQPYLGLGIGGIWNYQYQQVSVATYSTNSFDLLLAPEVGALVSLAKGGSNIALDLRARYVFTTADIAKNSPGGGTSNAQFMSFQAGLAWFYY